MMEEKRMVATLCFLVWNGLICLAVKKRKIGSGRLNGYGGKPELGESLEEATIRELLEESGSEQDVQVWKKSHCAILGTKTN